MKKKNLKEILSKPWKHVIKAIRTLDEEECTQAIEILRGQKERDTKDLQERVLTRKNKLRVKREKKELGL